MRVLFQIYCSLIMIEFVSFKLTMIDFNDKLNISVSANTIIQINIIIEWSPTLS